MSKKNYFLIAMALMLAVIYMIYFTSWFRAKTIQISCTSRPSRTAPAGAQAGAQAEQVMFALDNDYSLNEIKIAPLDAVQTNKLGEPVWHLVSDEGSDDLRMFSYGERISGMDPAVAGTQAEPLRDGVTYRLTLVAGKAKGHLDFQLGPPKVAPPTSPAKPAYPDD